MKDAYYFSHDSNARNDIKMIKLRQKIGLKGVGLYWCVIEILRETEGYELKLSDIPAICYELRCKPEEFNILFELDLLVKENDVFYSKSLKNRMLRIDEIKHKRSISGAKGGKSKANAKHLLNNCKAIKENNIIENNSKENNSKVNEINNTNAIDDNEFLNFIYSICPELDTHFKNEKLKYAFIQYLGVRKVSGYTLTPYVITQLITNLRRLSDGNGDRALEIVNRAILGSHKQFYSNEN